MLSPACTLIGEDIARGIHRRGRHLRGAGRTASLFATLWTGLLSITGRTLVVITVLAALLLLSSPQAAAEGAPAACRVPADRIDTAVDALVDGGWDVLPAGTLPDDIADQLVWLFVAQYMTGDTGGETLNSILELQQSAVKGLARKRDTSDSKTRLLTGEAGAMIVLWHKPGPDRIEFQCRLALAGPDAPGETPFTPREKKRLSDGYVTAVALDRAALTRETGRDVVTAQLVETYLTYPAGVRE